jgi:hypothetical protein
MGWPFQQLVGHFSTKHSHVSLNCAPLGHTCRLTKAHNQPVCMATYPDLSDTDTTLGLDQ